MIQSVNILEIVKKRNKLTLIRTPGPPAWGSSPRTPLSLASHMHSSRGEANVCTSFTFNAYQSRTVSLSSYSATKKQVVLFLFLTQLSFPLHCNYFLINVDLNSKGSTHRTTLTTHLGTVPRQTPMKKGKIKSKIVVSAILFSRDYHHDHRKSCVMKNRRGKPMLYW